VKVKRALRNAGGQGRSSACCARRTARRGRGDDRTGRSPVFGGNRTDTGTARTSASGRSWPEAACPLRRRLWRERTFAGHRRDRPARPSAGPFRTRPDCADRRSQRLVSHGHPRYQLRGPHSQRAPRPATPPSPRAWTRWRAAYSCWWTSSPAAPTASAYRAGGSHAWALVAIVTYAFREQTLIPAALQAVHDASRIANRKQRPLRQSGRSSKAPNV